MSFDPGTPLGPRGRQVQTETTGLRDGLSYTKKWFAKEKRERRTANLATVSRIFFVEEREMDG